MQELKALKTKVDAGAELLLSQLFFDNRLFYDFASDCKNNGITVPVTPGIMPVTSETPVENESISEDGITWYQKQGYTAYRIWVQNDTNREMKVTVTYTGMPAGRSLVFRVQAGKSKSMVVNKARAGVQYYADFQTDDGSFEGICSVRISDTPFN